MRSEWVLLLAGDLARLDSRDLRFLLRHRGSAAAVIPLDAGGWPEPLAATYRTASLRRTLRLPGGIQRMSDLVRGASRVRFLPFRPSRSGPSPYRLHGVNEPADLDSPATRGRWGRAWEMEMPSRLFRSARAACGMGRHSAASALFRREAARLRASGLEALAGLAEQDAARCRGHGAVLRTTSVESG